MNPRTVADRNAALFLVAAKKNEAPRAGRPVGLRIPHRRGVDPANEMRSALPSAAARLNAPLFGIFANHLMYTPAFGYLMETAAKSFASSVALHRNWLTMVAPYAVSPAASRSGSECEVTADTLARSMDIAIGECFEELSDTECEAQLAEELLARSMDAALGERDAA